MHPSTPSTLLNIRTPRCARHVLPFIMARGYKPLTCTHFPSCVCFCEHVCACVRACVPACPCSRVCVFQACTNCAPNALKHCGSTDYDKSCYQNVRCAHTHTHTHTHTQHTHTHTHEHTHTHTHTSPMHMHCILRSEGALEQWAMARAIGWGWGQLACLSPFDYSIALIRPRDSGTR